MINCSLLYISHRHGFTIFELLISITVSLSILAATYQLFHSQNKSYIRQDQTIETQQNLRAIVSVITKDIQMAGYDPKGRANPGIVTQFPPPHDVFNIDYKIHKDIIGFTTDTNGDGSLLSQDNEMIAYRINNKFLERYNSKEARWDILSENIDALNFVYLDQDGNVTDIIEEFRAVEVSILSRTNKKDSGYSNTYVYTNKQGDELCLSCVDDSYHRRLVSITLQLRNLNL